MGRALLLTWSLSFGADAVSTHTAIAQHGAQEILLPSQNPVTLDAIIAGEAVLGWWAIGKVRSKHPKTAQVIFWTVSAIHVGAAIHNYSLR